MRSKTSLLAFGWLAFVALACVLLWKQWSSPSGLPIETDILKLLPVNQQNPVAEQAFNRIAERMGNKVLFVLEAKESQPLLSAADAFSQQLETSGYFSSVNAKINQSQQQAWAQYYFTHRAQFLTEQQRQRLANQPEKQVQHVIQSLYNPFSGVTSTELQNDPFLLFRDYLSQLSQLTNGFNLQNGYLTINQGQSSYIFISADLKESPYSLAAQQAVPHIEEWQQELQHTYDVAFYHTGVLFYADFGTQSAKQEISTIGLVSLIGVIGLIVVVFRSATPLSLALLSIGIGLLVALTATIVLFGKVHLFSLVFGASLIGVSIDYAFHYLTDRLAAGKKWNSKKGLQHILSAITLGLITSLIGYLGLLVAPFPGLQQLALFSAIGLASAYLTVVAWYPILAVKPSQERPLPGKTLWHWWLNCWNKPQIRFGLPASLLVASVIALSHVHYDDDIRQLQAMPESLKSQETTIKTLTGAESAGVMLVVNAKSDEALLQRLESLDSQLKTWTQQNVIESYQSLSQYISSTALQANDFSLVKQLYQQQSQTLASTLKQSEQVRFEQVFNPVSLQDYLTSDVSMPTRFMYLGKIEDHTSAVVMLNGLTNVVPVVEFAKQNQDITYLNKADDISQLFSQYRIKVMELLAIAATAILLLLTWRYGFKHSVFIVLPCVIACFAGLAITVLTGSSLNLFNLLALVLILGIGIDYTLFFAEQQGSHSTIVAITLSAMTTLLSFGLLALSQTHAIHSFGLTVLSGILVAWLLAPMAIKGPTNNEAKA